MRSLEEIREEMADSAQAAQLAQEAGVHDALTRHVAWYQALAWVLQEPWKAES